MKFPQDSVHQKLLKSVHFRRVIHNIKGDQIWRIFLTHSVYCRRTCLSRDVDGWSDVYRRSTPRTLSTRSSAAHPQTSHWQSPCPLNLRRLRTLSSSSRPRLAAVTAWSLICGFTAKFHCGQNARRSYNYFSDDHDIEREIHNMFVCCNVLYRKFCKCSLAVKVFLVLSV